MPAHRVGSNIKGRSSKEAILRAATTVFADHGYRGTTMALVAAAASLTHPGLLYHFPNKEQLLFAVMDRHLVPGVTRVERAAEDGSEAVFATLREIADENLDDPEWVRLASVLMAESLAPDHPAHAYFAERTSRIASALSAGLSDLDPDPARRLSIARFLNASWDGLRMHSLLDPSIDVLGDLERLVDLVRRAGTTGG
ncbi:TetR/AcrR family transcriptional regulator [Microbacterium sp. NPDC077184]|uniref:TetR/AcrR family transcriptional regulator n=1 Tax=Microbacterium sp. NPDC077184 TaxID=3154764 RepID=UPI00343BC394